MFVKKLSHKHGLLHFGPLGLAVGKCNIKLHLMFVIYLSYMNMSHLNNCYIVFCSRLTGWSLLLILSLLSQVGSKIQPKLFLVIKGSNFQAVLFSVIIPDWRCVNLANYGKGTNLHTKV